MRPSPQVCWLAPEQTAGKKKPFVYTQGQAVLNRAFFPCFDTPAVKCRYSALLEVRGPCVPALGTVTVLSIRSPFRGCLQTL